jgi:hypothetical protein
MRRDARDLLDKLGRREVQYRQFVDSAADMELWPIFEALLRDTRVVGQGGGEALEERRLPGHVPEEIDEAPDALRTKDDVIPRPPATRSRADSGMFGRYGTPVSPASRSTDVRVFLSRLSEER